MLKLNNMNNKEKAEEIAYENNVFGRFIMDRIEATCLEMAEWKDEQFLKFLLWLDDNCIIKKLNGEPVIYSDLIDNFKSVQQQ